MPNLAIDEQLVNSYDTGFTHLNSNAMTLYRDAFQNFLRASESAGPGAQQPVEPDPPQLIVFDTTKALQLVLAYDNALTAGLGDANGVSPTLDLSTAIAHVQAARLQKPTRPVTPQPSSPVGPSQGVKAASGNPMYYTVTGDTLPDGAMVQDARGSFEKHIVQTPFGGESYWEKIG